MAMLQKAARLSHPFIQAAGRPAPVAVFSRHVSCGSLRFETRLVPAQIQRGVLARSFSSDRENGEGSRQNESNGGFDWRSHRVAVLWAATGLGSTVLCEGEAEAKKENTELMNTLLDGLSPLMSQMTIGSVMGYATGKALQTAGNMLAIFVGTSFVILQGLAYKGYISVNWSKTVDDTKSLLDMDGDGDFDTDDMKLIAKKFIEVCTFNLPGGAGFTAGLLFGLGFGGKTAGTAAAALGTASIVPRALMIGGGATAGPGVMVSVQEEYQRWSNKAKDTFSKVSKQVDPVEAFKNSIQGIGLAQLRDVEAKMKEEMTNATDPDQKAGFVATLKVIEEAKKAAKSASKK